MRFTAFSNPATVGRIGVMAVVIAVTGALLSGPASPSVASPAVLEVTQSVTPATSAAITGSDFAPGYIISDQLFFQRDAMTQTQIQAFLDLKIGTCQNSNCLNVVRTTTTTRLTNKDNICEPYIGATDELASEIIYKVQTACGISAKVLLATLQKEQGLVTATAPTDLKLRKAMGYGCPDTSVCDSKYYGLYNQLYNAAWQFRHYSDPTPVGNFRIGVKSVQYHPNTDCGTTSVNILNHATAALYNYTPYTPNAAALANLGGTGDSCSSYGNRNFWVYFTSWFGSTIAGAGEAALNAAYQDAGGATGVLGAQVTGSNCGISSACSRTYVNGFIGWNVSSGAFAIYGPIWERYRAAGGVTSSIGYPAGNIVAITGANGDGFSQAFELGQIVSSASGTYILRGTIQKKHAALLWVRGPLGWPTGDLWCESLASGICGQTFQYGAISQLSSTPYVSDGAIGTKYLAAGGPTGSLGVGSGVIVAITGPQGDGSSQAFRGGQIVSSTSGTFILSGAIKTAHAAAGWVRGSLGWPTADAVCVSGACSQSFQGGIVSVRGSVAYISDGVIGAKLVANGGSSSPLGAAVAPITAITGPNGDGSSQGFDNGQIVSSAAGTFILSGAIRAKHAELLWVRGSLGWPTADAVCDSAGNCTQTFQNGSIVANVGAAAYVVTNDAISVKYTASGGTTGPLGAPTGETVAITGPNGNGSSRAFKNGQIVSSASGTFILSGAIRAKHAELLWVRGSLGWPTADAVCDSAGNCTQTFQNGTIAANVGSPAYVVTTDAISVKYAASGGTAGPLGVPTGETVSITGPNGNGSSRAFANGQIVSSTSGTFILSGAIRAKHAELLWVRGSLGWPTADAVCTGGNCSQAFQFGQIVANAGTPAYVVSTDAISVKYTAAGGPTGALGAPAGNIVAITGPNGDGRSQAFANGQIVSSTSGTFILSGAIRTKHAELLWVRGALGWPTADAVCTGSNCTQTFQHGSISSTSSGVTVTY